MAAINNYYETMFLFIDWFLTKLSISLYFYAENEYADKFVKNIQ